MAHCRTCALAWSPPQVFEAAVSAARELGFTISQADRAAGRLYLDQPRLVGGRPRRLDLSVTDSGLGTTVVHISWSSRRRVFWPLGSEARTAGRLCRCTERTLARGWSPPFGREQP